MSYTGPARSILPPIVSSTDEEEYLEEVGSANETDEVMTTSAAEDRVLLSTVATKYDYIYLGSQLVQMTATTTVDNGTPTTKTLNFAYDASGTPATVTYDGATYYYITNLQGDVMAILNASGTAVVEYTYDAWGSILTITGSMADTLGEFNPLRYRGYVYDTESTLYYLQSRYYDPEKGRFINADAYASTGQGLLGNNMFAYCNNNPVNYNDPSGRLSEFSAIAYESDDYFTPVGHSLVALGYSIVLNEGHICMDMDAAAEEILSLTDEISISEISQVLAAIACARYNVKFGQEFLLADKCVGIEIEDHIDAYYWATGERLLPNYLAAGFCVKNMLGKNNYDANSVYAATRYIDIRESDVIANGGLSSQASVFNYKGGIRDIYIGTARDPWAESR